MLSKVCASIRVLVVGNGAIVSLPPSIGRRADLSATASRLTMDVASTYAVAEPTLVKSGAMTAAATGPVAAHVIPWAAQRSPSSVSPLTGSRQVTPRTSRGVGGCAMASEAYV